MWKSFQNIRDSNQHVAHLKLTRYVCQLFLNKAGGKQRDILRFTCFKLCLGNAWASGLQEEAKVGSPGGNSISSEPRTSEGLKFSMQFISSFLTSSPNLPFQLISCHSNLSLKLITFLGHFMQFCAASSCVLSSESSSPPFCI